MSLTIGTGCFVHPTVVFDGDAEVGFCSYLGFGPDWTTPTRVSVGVRIGCFCLICHGAFLGENVEIDHYCRIGERSVIGRNSKILYGAEIFDDVVIGENCIIAGDVSDRAVIEDEVTYSGSMAHTSRDPTADWDTTEEPSPVIKRGSVIGAGSLIIGGVSIGPQAYVNAGEIVKCDVPAGMVLHSGLLSPLSDFRGMIKVRGL